VGTVRKEKAKIKSEAASPPMRLRVALPPPEAKPFDLVGVGESSLDLVAQVDGVPQPDAKLALERFETLPGGQAATALVACARQGWRTRYLGCLGTDAWGGAIEAALRQEGVDVSGVIRREVRSRLAIVLVDRRTGRRTVLEYRDPGQRLAAGDLDVHVVTSGRILLVDATDVAAASAAARQARAAGVPTVVDIERPAPGVEELLEAVDVLIAAESFPAAFTGAASVGDGLRRLAARYRPAMAVATLGQAGSLAICEGRELHTPAPSVQVVDTTGAGDAFRGGFISAWLRFGPDAPVSRMLEYANTVAALSCQHFGAQTGLPTRAEVDARVTRGPDGQSK
jgi:sugar/nucleoside kinase (ribokinase family)